MTTSLVLPSGAYEYSYRAYIEELGDEERYPFPLDFDNADFGALLRRLDDFAQGRNLLDGYVPSSTFWLVEGPELIGVSNLRHRLNERIRECGGHVGLGIRPSRRGRGLGNKLMQLTILEARRRGLGELHIHCHKGNVPSARMIVASGGVLESEFQPADGSEPVLRFVVPAGRP
jgi:predicted acetyltransferase